MYDSSYRVCRNIRWKDSTIDLEENRLENILRLKDELENGIYKQKPFYCFSIVERGKPRDIRACHIYDRLLQNTLCETVLIPELTPSFIYDNTATLKGKGIDFALKRAKIHLQKAGRKWNEFYALRIDIKKYFDSINHDALKATVRHIITDEETLDVINGLIDTFNYSITKDTEFQKDKQYFTLVGEEFVPATEFKKGVQYYEYNELSLGLGSQTSQLLALLTLNGLDHYVKEQLHLKFYGRYMDDAYAFHNDKDYLQNCLELIDKELSKIGLKLNRKKTCIIKIEPGKRKNPFKFLKWNFYLTDTFGIIQLPFKEKITKQHRKLRKMQQKYLKGELSIEDIQLSYSGWRVTMSKGNCYNIIKKMDKYFNTLFEGVEII